MSGHGGDAFGLDLVTSEVFSSLNNSMIIFFLTQVVVCVTVKLLLLCKTVL